MLIIIYLFILFLCIRVSLQLTYTMNPTASFTIHPLSFSHTHTDPSYTV